jgi:hypothetical protein
MDVVEVIGCLCLSSCVDDIIVGVLAGWLLTCGIAVHTSADGSVREINNALPASISYLFFS